MTSTLSKVAGKCCSFFQQRLASSCKVRILGQAPSIARGRSKRLNDDELDNLLYALRETEEMESIVLLAVETRMRRSELLSMKWENTAKGFEVGEELNIVMDASMAKNATTTTLQDDVYAFVFGQKGLMTSLGLQGSKIIRVNP